MKEDELIALRNKLEEIDQVHAMQIATLKDEIKILRETVTKISNIPEKQVEPERINSRNIKEIVGKSGLPLAQQELIIAAQS